MQNPGYVARAYEFIQDFLDAVVTTGTCAAKGTLHALDIRGMKVLDTPSMLPDAGLATNIAIATARRSSRRAATRPAAFRPGHRR